MNGEAVKEARKRLGMSQDQLAKKSHVSQVLISRIENGTLKDTTLERAMAIAEALSCDVRELALKT